MSLSLKTGVQISLLGSCEDVPLARCLVNDRKAFGRHNGQKVMVNFYSFGVLAETLLLAISNGHTGEIKGRKIPFWQKGFIGPYSSFGRNFKLHFCTLLVLAESKKSPSVLHNRSYLSFSRHYRLHLLLPLNVVTALVSGVVIVALLGGPLPPVVNVAR